MKFVARFGMAWQGEAHRQGSACNRSLSRTGANPPMKIDLIPIKRVTRVKESRCPECNRELDAMSSTHHAEPPRPGDVTVCLYCGEILKISASIEPERMTAKEWHAFRSENPDEAKLAEDMSQQFRDAVVAAVFPKPRLQ